MEKRITKNPAGEKYAAGPKLDEAFTAREKELRDINAIDQSQLELSAMIEAFDKLEALEQNIPDPVAKLTANQVSKIDLAEISDRIEDEPEPFGDGGEQTLKADDLLVPQDEIPDAEDIDTLLKSVQEEAFSLPTGEAEEEVDDADLVDGPVVAAMAAAGATLPAEFTVLSAEDIARNRSSLEAMMPAKQEVAMKNASPDTIRQALTAASDWSDQVEVDPADTVSAEMPEDMDPEFLHREFMDKATPHDDRDEEDDQDVTVEESGMLSSSEEDELTAKVHAAAAARAAAEARLAAEIRAAAEARAEEERLQEKQRAIEEARRADEARKADEIRKAEEARRAEDEARAESLRIEEEEQLEAQRAAEEAVRAYRARKRAENEAAEHARIAAENREELERLEAARRLREEDERHLMAASFKPTAAIEAPDEFDDLLNEFHQVGKPNGAPETVQTTAPEHQDVSGDAFIGSATTEETSILTKDDDGWGAFPEHNQIQEDERMGDDNSDREELNVTEIEQARAKRKAKIMFYLATTAAAAVIAGAGFFSFFPGSPQPSSQIAASDTGSLQIATSDAVPPQGGAEQGQDGLASLQDIGEAAANPQAAPGTQNLDVAQGGVSLEDLARGLVPEAETIDLNDLFLTGQPPAPAQGDAEEVIAEVAPPDAEVMAAMEQRFEDIGTQIDSVITGIEERDARLMAIEAQLADAMARAERAESLAIAQNQVLVRFVAAEEKLEIAEQLIVDLSRRISSVENFNPADAEVVEAKLTELDTNFKGLQRDVGMVARMAINGSPTQVTGRTQGQPLSNFDGATNASMRTAAATPDAVPASVKVGDHVNGYGTVLEIFGVSDGGRMVVMENGTVVLN